MNWVSWVLSGLLCPVVWHLIAKRLNENGIIPNMITNGWLMNEEIADKAVCH